MVNKLLQALFLSITLLSFSAMATEEGRTDYFKKIGVWSSGILHVNNTDIVRLLTTSALLPVKSGLVLNFSKNKFAVYMSINKTGNEIGNVYHKDPIEVPCEPRVDTNPVISSTCLMYDDNTNIYLLYANIANVYYQLIDELKAGNTLRTKIGTGNNASYDRYSLKGFSRSYSRAMSLLNRMNNDSDYFR